MNFRPEQTDNEKLARQLAGPDTEATHIYMGNGEQADDVIRKQKAAKFNQEVGDLQDKFQKHIDTIQEAGRQIAADLQNLEIMPLTSYVLITPFKENPFQPIKVENGLITDLGGLTPTYKSQETGRIEEEQQYVKVGMVVETGTDCKFLKAGDIVIYNIASEVQVPFFKFGFVVVAEQRIVAVVNEGLTQRKKDIIEKQTKDK